MAAAAKDSQPPRVFAAIAEVMADLAEIGIGKNHKNRDQGFDYRGIDDVYNVLSKLLSKHRLVIIPQVKTREVVVNKTKNGSNFYFVTLFVEYQIFSAEDGSTVMASAFGEASDMGDKATNKAMSTAYKYLCLQLFCIPIDVPDADATTPPETLSENDPLPEGRAQKASEQQPKTNGKTQSTAKSSKADPAVLHALTDQAHEATTDEELVKVAGEIYTANKHGQLSAVAAKELALTVTSKRSGIVKAPQIESLRKMAKTFHDAGLLTAAESDVAITTAESRLNIGE